MDSSIVVPIAVDTPRTVVRDAPEASMSLIAPPDFLANAAAPSRYTASSHSQPTASEEEIARLRLRVREIATQLTHAQEAGRRRIARDLHDGVGAELTATRFALASVETWLPADAPVQCTQALAIASRSLDAMCEAIRHVVAELHAPQLDAGIVGALRRWIDDFSVRTGLQMDFVCAADARLAHLSADAALAVFRVTQEALNNAAKHARATRVEVRIETGRRHLSLLVSDNGVGLPRRFRANVTRNHFGIAGMRARCEAFDGTLRVGACASAGAGQSPGATLRARFAWDTLLASAMTSSPAPTAGRAPRATQAITDDCG